MRIAIVSHNPVMIETVRTVLATIPEHRVAWVAFDGNTAIEKCLRDTPDLILMGLNLPHTDGAEVTRRIMQTSPCAILVVADNVSTDTPKVFEAMGYGALDAVDAPVPGPRGSIVGSELFLRKVGTVAKLIGKSSGKPSFPTPLEIPLSSSSGVPALVAIGSSTGGPQALLEVLSTQPRDFDAAMVIIQHVDARFATGLASWLNERTGLNVKAATEGCRPKAGTILVAVTNDHLVFAPDLTLHYTPNPRDCPFRPSVDVFFKSAAEHYPRKSAAVLLTGMGRDGADGLLLLRSKGWYTIVQDKATSIVYGMPKAAVELGAAVDILPLDRIGPSLAQWLSSGKGTGMAQRSHS